MDSLVLNSRECHDQIGVLILRHVPYRGGIVLDLYIYIYIVRATCTFIVHVLCMS